MRFIDLDTWKRKDHFLFFQRMDYPQYNICMNIDVTRFLKFTKEKELSFYYSMIFAATTAVNRVEELRYRIRDGKVVFHEIVHPSFTDMSKDEKDDLFKFVTVDLEGDISEFVEKAKQASETQRDYFGMEKVAGRDDLIYITCIPWISFTHLSHTISLNKNDAVPRISWGKYFREGDKVLLPFSVQVNHALVDGFHVGKYIDVLQELLDGIE